MQSPLSCRFVRFAITLIFLCLLNACGGGGSDSPRTTPPPPTPEPPPPPPQVTEEIRIDAVRLLTQATFGAKLGEVESTAQFLANNSVEEWIDEQATAEVTLHYPTAKELRRGEEDLPGAAGRRHRLNAWWRATLLGDDQLRQRVAFALSQLFVISENSQLFSFQVELANWYDLLLNNAFGNYRDLMEETTKSPVMGLYLSMMGNEKPQEELNIRPDENFARELMQLFTIGLYELNIDGSLVLDAQNQPIPTYDQDIIEAYAHVYTGWHFKGKNIYNWNFFFAGNDFISPMEVVTFYHDTSEQNLLNDYVVPAGTNGYIALDIALDSLFYHDNVGPFVAKHMIKHLVTSNPSPEYIARVASAFNDNGEGVRGDMLSVVKAVLLDEEARNESYFLERNYGRVKQPILKSAQTLRALMGEDVTLETAEEAFPRLARIQDFIAQSPLGAPSVFNFFSPDHQVNGELAELQLITPEFQMVTSNNLIRNINVIAFFLYSPEEVSIRESLGIDFSPYRNLLTNDPNELIDTLNYIFLQGHMSEDFKQVLLEYDTQIAPSVDDNIRVIEMLNLVLTSPQFSVQR